MIGLAISFLALILTFLQARKSLGAGLSMALFFGYNYGLIRARLNDTGASFIYDATLFGLYAGGFTRVLPREMRERSATALNWTIALVAWPFFCLTYSPLLPTAQPFLVQLVGIRAAIITVPCLIIGARAAQEDAIRLAKTLSVLNICSFAVAMLEYVFGIDAILPRNALTELIYASHDVYSGGVSFHRIPSSFIASHAYGGTMVLSIPFLLHGLEQNRKIRILCWAGLACAIVGVFACGARQPVIMLLGGAAFLLASQQGRLATRFAIALTGGAIAFLITRFERFQRFTTLSDTATVQSRLHESMNTSFFDVVAQYPIGSGLATAAGTTIPAFLAREPGVRRQIGIESEYSHIVLEQGLLGLLLWLIVIAACVLRMQWRSSLSALASTYLRANIVFSWVSALIGAGLLYSAPGGSLLLFSMGMGLASQSHRRQAVRETVPRGTTSHPRFGRPLRAPRKLAHTMPTH